MVQGQCKQAKKVGVDRGIWALKLEFCTEISPKMFHSWQPADLNFPPKFTRHRITIIYILSALNTTIMP